MVDTWAGSDNRALYNLFYNSDAISYFSNVKLQIFEAVLIISLLQGTLLSKGHVV